MSGSTAFEQMKGPVRSTSITWFHCSRVISVMGILFMIPALLTRMSTDPNFALTSATKAFT